MTIFFQAYLVAFVFWLGLSLGCLAILMVHHLAGGRWGYVVRRFLEAGTRTLPLMAMLFVPLLFGTGVLYEWTHETQLHHRAYLNLPFFLVRAGIYFAAWLGLMWALDRAADRQDREPGKVVTRRLTGLSAGGLIAYGLTATFAAIDWVMSLEPHWFSSIFGVLFIAGQVLSAFAFVIVALTWQMKHPPLAGAVAPQQLHDLGNFLLTFVIFWAYVTFSQYLIIWMGNLPEEITWYTSRLAGGWRWLALALIVLHFFVPFLLLLSRDVKRRPTPLAVVAGGVWLMGIAVTYWLVVPAFQRGLHWLDPVLMIVVGALWLAVFRYQLRRRALLPVHDARVEEVYRWA